MAHVCILYAVENQAFATRIEEALSALGYGVSRREVVEESCFAYGDGADESEAMIVIWSTSSISSPAVIAEARAALARRSLTPVAIGKVEPPPSFQHLWPIELSGWTGALEDPRWRFVVDEINLSVRRAEVGFEDVDMRLAGGAGGGAMREAPRYSGRSVIMGAALSLTVLALGAIVFAPYIIGERERQFADVNSAPVRRIAPGEAIKAALPGKIENDVFAQSDDQIAAGQENADQAGKALAANLRGDPTANPIAEAKASAQDAVDVKALQEMEQPALPDTSQLDTQAPDEGDAAADKASDHNALDQDGADSGDQRDVAAANSDEDETSRDEISREENAPEDNGGLAFEDLERALSQEISEVEAIEETLALEAAEDNRPDQTEAETSTLDDQGGDAGAPAQLLPEASTVEAAEEATLEVEPVAELAVSETALDETAANETSSNDTLAQQGPTAETAQDQAPLDARYFRDCAECPEMVEVPAGVFSMGSPSTEPVRAEGELSPRDISITARYALGAKEVTYAQWDACVAAGVCEKAAATDPGWGRGERPVVNISWADAQDYLRWLSTKTGHTYRLPSEAEWEYAARAGAKTPFSFGSSVTSDQANFNGTYKYGGPVSAYRRRTTPVGSFSANAFGLFDMHGNVWEWTSNCWSTNGQAAQVQTDAACDERVLKGGAWNSGGWRLRAGHRISGRQAYRDYDNGFRVARTLP